MKRTRSPLGGRRSQTMVTDSRAWKKCGCAVDHRIPRQIRILHHELIHGLGFPPPLPQEDRQHVAKLVPLGRHLRLYHVIGVPPIGMTNPPYSAVVHVFNHHHHVAVVIDEILPSTPSSVLDYRSVQHGMVQINEILQLLDGHAPWEETYAQQNYAMRCLPWYGLTCLSCRYHSVTLSSNASSSEHPMCVKCMAAQKRALCALEFFLFLPSQ